MNKIHVPKITTPMSKLTQINSRIWTWKLKHFIFQWAHTYWKSKVKTSEFLSYLYYWQWRCFTTQSPNHQIPVSLWSLNQAQTKQQFHYYYTNAFINLKLNLIKFMAKFTMRSYRFQIKFLNLKVKSNWILPLI